MIQIKKDFTLAQYDRICDLVITGTASRVELFLDHMFEYYGVQNLDDLYIACDGLQNVRRVINLIDLKLSLQ